MATLTLRNVKGTPLTNQEADDNLANLLVAIGGTNSTPYTIPTPTGTGVPVLSINPTIVGTLTVGGPTLSTSVAAIELGSGRTGDGYAYIDMSTSAGTDYNLRLIHDPGINGESTLTCTGTGGLRLRTENAAPIYLMTSSTNRMVITDAGNIGIGISSPLEQLHLYKAASAGQLIQDANGAFRFLTTGGINYIQSGLALTTGSSAPLVFGNIFVGSEWMRITAAGNVGIGTGATVNYKLQVNGSFAATTKSFVIDHPTKPDMKLRYGSLEGPENGVYVRGRLKDSNVIELPDYWTGLVDESTITVNLTAIGKLQDLWVDDIIDNTVIVCGSNVNCFYTIFAERKDVEKLVVEF